MGWRKNLRTAVGQVSLLGYTEISGFEVSRWYLIYDHVTQLMPRGYSRLSRCR